MSSNPLVIFADAAISPSLGGLHALARHIFGDNDAAWQKAVTDDIQDVVNDLLSRVERLEKARAEPTPRPPAIASQQLLEDFLAAIRGTSSVEKREALINAMAKQFSGGMKESVRRYWWEKIKSAPDATVALIAYIGTRRLAIPYGGGAVLSITGHHREAPLGFSAIQGQEVGVVTKIEATTFIELASQSAQNGENFVVSLKVKASDADLSDLARRGLNNMYSVVALTDRGDAFLDAMTIPSSSENP